MSLIPILFLILVLLKIYEKSNAERCSPLCYPRYSQLSNQLCVVERSGELLYFENLPILCVQIALKVAKTSKTLR